MNNFSIVLEMFCLHESNSVVKKTTTKKRNRGNKSFCAQRSFSSSFPTSLRGIKAAQS